MKPTPITDPLAVTLADRPKPVSAPFDISTGAIVLSGPEQQAQVEQVLRALDFVSMPSAQIALLGREVEQGLHQTLDGFLSRLDSKTASALFKLFDRLQKGVNDADLPAVLEQVQKVDRVGVVQRVLALFSGKSQQDLINEAYEQLRGLMETKTKTLKDEMNKLERELGTECQKLLAELQVLENLKHAYSEHREHFAVAAAATSAFHQQAKQIVDERRAELEAAPDPAKRAKLQDLEAKLQMLESRALALEGTYTRLPADQMVIQQIEQAGVSTLQETVTTASGRFASIKMTLLALHGALTVKNVQSMSEHQAKLDRQLQEIRGQVVKEVATTAASAPGDSRMAQAKHIEQIIAQTQEINEIVAKAREENSAKFADARATFQQAREDLSKFS